MTRSRTKGIAEVQFHSSSIPSDIPTTAWLFGAVTWVYSEGVGRQGSKEGSKQTRDCQLLELDDRWLR